MEEKVIKRSGLLESQNVEYYSMINYLSIMKHDTYLYSFFLAVLFIFG